MVRKLLGWIGKGLLAVLTVIAVYLLFFWIRNQLYIGRAQESTVAYLSSYQREISKTSVNTDLFSDDFYRNHVFLLGENHGVADVQVVDELLVKHLNQKIGLRYYLAEMDSIRAKHLNEFLTNPKADILLLKQVVHDVGRRIPQQAGQELFEKWLHIRDYNQSIADSLQITVIGLDKALEDTSQTINRDSAMFLNFQQVVTTRSLEDEYFYGLLGYTHVVQQPVFPERFTPFAAKIRRSGMSFANSIKSIVCLNLDSEVRLPATGQMPTPPDEKTSLLNVDGPIIMVRGVSDLEKAAAGQAMTLFNLEAADSPYQRSQRLAGVKVNLMGRSVLPTDNSHPTVDFFQYVVLIRSGEAITTLE